MTEGRRRDPGPEPPPDPEEGDMQWRTDEGKEYIYRDGSWQPNDPPPGMIGHFSVGKWG